MTKKQKKTTNIVIIIIIILLLAGWGIASWKSGQNKLPPTEVSTISQHEKGDLESEIEIVEFSDFQCPACKSVLPMTEQVLENFDNVKLVFKHYPLNSIHPNAQLAAQATESAGLQNKFWEMHDILFENQEAWSNSISPQKQFLQYAEELDLNVEQFEADLQNETVLAKIKDDIAEGDALGILGTPSLYINGVLVNSYQEIVDFITK